MALELLERALEALKGDNPNEIEAIRAELEEAADEPGQGELIAIARALLDAPDE